MLEDVEAQHDVECAIGKGELLAGRLDEGQRAVLCARVAKQLQAAVETECRAAVAAQPGNCKVYINDRLIDETPFDQQLVPGRYQFRFEWPTQSRTLTETITASTTEVFGTPETR